MSNIRSATTAEIIKLHSVLKDVLIMEPDANGEKYCRYKNGWNDKRVAETVSMELNQNHAQRVRKDMYGKLFAGRPSDKDARFAALEHQVETLSRRVDALATELGYNIKIIE